MKITDKKILKTVTLNTTVEKAWCKWVTPDGLRSFFGRDNRIELKPGGDFEIYFMMDMPYGLKGSEGCKVLSYIPNKLFSFTWNAPPSLMAERNSGYYTWVVVEFKDSGGKTEITLTHLGWPEGDNWQKVYDYFDSAWGRVLEGLEKSV